MQTTDEIFLNWVDKLEVNEKRKKVMTNRYFDKAKKGLYITGSVPLGYNVDKEYNYTKNESVNAVKEMFLLAERGMQYKGLQCLLKDIYGIDNGKNPLRKISIIQILRNPIYCGKFAFQRTANIEGRTHLIPREYWLMLDEHFEHLEVIPLEVFEVVNERIEKEWDLENIPFVKDISKYMDFK